MRTWGETSPGDSLMHTRIPQSTRPWPVWDPADTQVGIPVLPVLPQTPPKSREETEVRSGLVTGLYIRTGNLRQLGSWLRYPAWGLFSKQQEKENKNISSMDLDFSPFL